MTKIILVFLALAVCAEATFDVLLLNLLKHKGHKAHHPPPPPPPPRPHVHHRPVQRLVPVVPVQLRYVYVERSPYVASYYRHPVSAPVDVPQFPTVSQASAAAFSNSEQFGSRLAQPAQSLSLPFAQSGPTFNVDQAPETQVNLDQNQSSDTVDVETVNSESLSFDQQPETQANLEPGFQ